jgi:hypothetical protein
LVVEIQSRVVAARRVLGKAGLEEITRPQVKILGAGVSECKMSNLGSEVKGLRHRVSNLYLSLGFDVIRNALRTSVSETQHKKRSTLCCD